MGRLGALLAAAIAASLHVMGSAAAQQAYPERTVRFILPYGAASASDTTARLFADRLSAKWGKPVVVENRPGGDGIVSMQAFVAANDDHTLWFGPAGASTVLPYQHDTLPIDPHPCMSTPSLNSWRWRGRSLGSSTPRRPAAFQISCCLASSRICD
jgi:tripartite-type tricarboxylate transporter receptor subunit TctC